MDINLERQMLEDTGGQYSNGLKQGLWKEPIENYWTNQELFYIQVISSILYWRFIRWQEGVSYYDEQGVKIGLQTEISESFFNLSQVTYLGEYYYGQKTGKWEIFWKNNQKVEQLGCELYGENGLKKGNWMQLAKDFNEDKQVTYKGEQNCGQKVGVWVTYFRFSEIFEEIGCVCYDDEGIQIKLLQLINSSKQIIYKGQYKNGKKFEQWQEFKRDKWKINEGFQKIGEMNYQN